MSILRKNKQGAPAGTLASASILPKATRKWRLIIGMRSGLVVGWLGGLTLCICFGPLSVQYAAQRFGGVFYDTMVTGIFAWIVSLCVLLAAIPFYDRYIEKTFQRKDIAYIGCWIESAGMVPSSQHISLSDLLHLLRHGTSRAGRSSLDRRFAPAADVTLPGEKVAAYNSQYLAARNALREHLPLLSEETVSLLRPRERRYLYEALAGIDKELILAILPVTPLFCEESAVPFVRALAEGKGLAANDVAIKMEAQACLRQLEERLEHSRGELLLLRPSQAPSAPEEQLLKPVQGSHDTDPNELLRADTQG